MNLLTSSMALHGRIGGAWALAICVLMLASMGCQSTYSSSHRYDPQPAELVWENVDDAGGSVRGLVSIIGLRYASASPADVPTFEVRLRLINQSDESVWLSPGDLDLTTASLESLDQPWLEPAGNVTVPPGGQDTVTAFFPASRDQANRRLDLEGLHLAVTLHRRDQVAAGADQPGLRRGISFTRRRNLDRHPHTMIHVGGGFGHGFGARHHWMHH